jgi:hypothetical protein
MSDSSGVRFVPPKAQATTGLKNLRLTRLGESERWKFDLLTIIDEQLTAGGAAWNPPRE